MGLKWFHSSILLSGAGSSGQEPQQTGSDFPVPGLFVQLLERHPKVLPGQQGDMLIPERLPRKPRYRGVQEASPRDECSWLMVEMDQKQTSNFICRLRSMFVLVLRYQWVIRQTKKTLGTVGVTWAADRISRDAAGSCLPSLSPLPGESLRSLNMGLAFTTDFTDAGKLLIIKSPITKHT